jgi:hypothetical protein
MRYLSFTLPRQHKAGLVRPAETISAAHRTQIQRGQNVFFHEIAGTRAVSLNTATVATLELLANHTHTPQNNNQRKRSEVPL